MVYSSYFTIVLVVTEAGYFNDLGGTFIYKQKRTIKWGKNGPPKDTPKCGFNNELCKKKEDSGISSEYLTLYKDLLL